MQFKTATIAAMALLAFSTALPTAQPSAATDITTKTWPTDLPDGLYTASKDTTGAFIIKSHNLSTSELSSLAASSNNSIYARSLPSPQTSCNFHGINPTDYAIARSGLNNFCNQGHVVNPSTAQLFLYGSAQIYMCNYSGNQQGCNSGEIDEGNALIDTVCGANQAGWVGISQWAKSYGRDNSGVPECW